MGSNVCIILAWSEKRRYSRDVRCAAYTYLVTYPEEAMELRYRPVGVDVVGEELLVITGEQLSHVA